MPQDAFMECMRVMQNYLQLLNHYFNTITLLTKDDFKDAFAQAQPWKFKADFTRSRILIDLCTTEELLEYFDKVQCLETTPSFSYSLQWPWSNVSREIHSRQIQLATARGLLSYQYLHNQQRPFLPSYQHPGN